MGQLYRVKVPGVHCPLHQRPLYRYPITTQDSGNAPADSSEYASHQRVGGYRRPWTFVNPREVTSVFLASWMGGHLMEGTILLESYFADIQADVIAFGDDRLRADERHGPRPPSPRSPVLGTARDRGL
ncbi:hypothetical protein EVAR_28292_1 [Eumeta japonica]|uniref:Uncharacterized protein n=1 Tax=Eumeta variegata TaxID=151549 RepID=A0A4C1VBW2_EUMVA|nr:hypothetical protein EVAR_28292_1 [Eumeta japonica]